MNLEIPIVTYKQSNLPANTTSNQPPIFFTL